MTLSPVVTHTAEATQRQPQTLRAISSPLKMVTSGQTSSSNGTPMPVVAPAASQPSAVPATLDLAEQMNDEEKRKYVKGSVPI